MYCFCCKCMQLISNLSYLGIVCFPRPYQAEYYFEEPRAMRGLKCIAARWTSLTSYT